MQGELEHQQVKWIYRQTNKKNTIKQMTRHECHETRLLHVHHAAHLKAMKDKGDITTNRHHVPFNASDELPYTNPSMHHHILDSCRHPQDVFTFPKHIMDDPVTKVCSGYH